MFSCVLYVYTIYRIPPKASYTFEIVEIGTLSWDKFLRQILIWTFTKVLRTDIEYQVFIKEVNSNHIRIEAATTQFNLTFVRNLNS